MADFLVSTSNLTKRFGKVRAVNSLSLSVREGDVLALLGPNGAGKSTILLMLCGILKPSEGHATIAGFRLPDESLSIKKVAGIVPDHGGFYDDLTAAENLLLAGRLHRMNGDDLCSRVRELLSTVGLTDQANRKVRGFSRGMLQRLAIAEAVLHRPRLLLLDEPTGGLDPEGVISLRQVLTNLKREEQVTMIIASHMLQEVEALCNVFAFIKDGSLKATRNLSELSDAISADGNCTVELVVDNIDDHLVEKMRGLTSVRHFQSSGTNMLLLEGSAAMYVDLATVVTELERRIVSIRTIRPLLEEAYRVYCGAS